MGKYNYGIRGNDRKALIPYNFHIATPQLLILSQQKWLGPWFYIEYFC